MTLKIVSAAVLAAVLSAAPAAAQLDSEGDDSDIVLLMQEMDGAIEDLEPFIGARNGVEALDAALFLQEALVWTQDHFAGKADAPEGVALAQAGHATAGLVVTALQAGDFDAAAESARELSRNCRACHDEYRP